MPDNEPTTESRLLSEFYEKYREHQNVFGIGICRDTPGMGGLYLLVFVRDQTQIDTIPRFYEDTPVVIRNSHGQLVPR